MGGQGEAATGSFVPARAQALCSPGPSQPPLLPGSVPGPQPSSLGPGPWAPSDPEAPGPGSNLSHSWPGSPGSWHPSEPHPGPGCSPDRSTQHSTGRRNLPPPEQYLPTLRGAGVPLWSQQDPVPGQKQSPQACCSSPGGSGSTAGLHPGKGRLTAAFRRARRSLT